LKIILLENRTEELTLEDMIKDTTYVEMIKMVDKLGGRLINGERIITV